MIRITTIDHGTGGHGSTTDAITTIIDTAAITAEAAESLGALVDADPVAVAGQVAAAGPVAVVVADDCPTQG